MTLTALSPSASSPTRVRPASTGDPVERVDPTRLRRVPKAYTTRFVAAAIDRDPDGYHLQAGADVVPEPGDVLLARVTEIGKHTRLESPVSRRQRLFLGQEILVAYGNRYAPDQFLAHIPDSLTPCHLVAGGGVAGAVTQMHASIDAPTAIEPIGLLADERGRITLERFAPLRGRRRGGVRPSAVEPPVIAVLGSSMNSGKSTTLACVVNGLTRAGLDVAAGKVTGTGSGNDPNLFRDAGATDVLDFTDFGHPSTFRLDHARIRELLGAMVGRLAAAGPDAIVIEIADGVYQAETQRLLGDPSFREHVDQVVFAAQDALGAAAGVRALEEADVATAAVSGVLTASPLGAREATEVLSVPVVDTYELCEPDVALALLPASPLRPAQ